MKLDSFLKERRTYLALSVLVLAYVIIGLCLISACDIIPGWGDPIDYIEGARNLTAYDSPFHPPFYSAVIAGVDLAVSNTFLSAKLVSFLSGIAVVILTFLLGRVCFRSDGVALLASALVVFSPLMLRHSYSVGSDMLGAGLFFGCLYVLSVAVKGSIKLIIVAGLLAALAYLTRYVFISLVPATMLFLLIFPSVRLRRRLLYAAVFLAGFVIVAAPWCIICLARHGDLHNWNYINIAFAVFDTTDSWLWFDTYVEKYPSLLVLLTSHPGEVGRHLAVNILHFPVEILARHGLLAGIMAVFGVFTMLRRPSTERMALILNGVALLGLIMLAWLKPRFFVPVLPVVMLFAAHFMVNGLAPTLAEYWPERASGQRLAKAIPLRSMAITLSVLTALILTVFRVPSDLAGVNVDDEKRAGLYLRENTPAGTLILTCSKNLAWYAERPFVSMTELRDVSPAFLQHKAQATDAKVLVYTERHSVFTHPQLRFLLNPEDSLIPPNFSLIYHDDGPWQVVAYRLE